MICSNLPHFLERIRMKVLRAKRNKKIVDYYRSRFGVSEPYQVIGKLSLLAHPLTPHHSRCRIYHICARQEAIFQRKHPEAARKRESEIYHHQMHPKCVEEPRIRSRRLSIGQTPRFQIVCAWPRRRCDR